MPLTWRELYAAAVLESDEQKLPSSIIEAEREMVRRARELFLAKGSDFEEEQAIDHTLLKLHLLRDSLSQKQRRAA